MFTFDVTKFVPRFLLNDKNGYAIAKAIEKGMQIMNDTVQQGVNVVIDVDVMPEWRLDELAWEYNIPYDYTADVEVKRGWIRNVYTLSRLYGTPEGVVQYMAPFFDGAAVQEAWEYNGDPYHFRMVFPDEWTPEKIAWATTAITTVKNVRSVLDGFQFERDWRCDLFHGCGIFGRESGTYHVPAQIIEGDYYTDEAGDIALDERGIIMMTED